MLLHVKKNLILISDCCYEKGYKYKLAIAEFFEDVSSSRNPRNARTKMIKLSPVTDCIKMNRAVGDECHCGANVAANLVMSLLKHKFVKPDKVQEVESFLKIMKSANGPMRRRYFLHKAYLWSADCFEEKSQTLACQRLSQYLLDGIRDRSLTYYGKVIPKEKYKRTKDKHDNVMETKSVNLNTKPAATSNNFFPTPTNSTQRSSTQPKVTSRHSHDNVMETKSFNLNTKPAATSNKLLSSPKKCNTA